MPEYVDTEIIIYGKRKDLEIFKEEVSETHLPKEYNSVFSFNKIIPMPENFSDYENSGPAPGRYYWQIGIGV